MVVVPRLHELLHSHSNISSLERKKGEVIEYQWALKGERVNVEGHPYDSRERLPEMVSGTLPFYCLCILDNST